jgi:uncharacterized protein YdaU (DUF1376 family)
MPLYIKDFLADTLHLSAAEIGAYLLLIMDYWQHDGLPDDDSQLAKIARVSPQRWRHMKPTLQAFFQVPWSHKRCEAEISKMIEQATRKKAAASKAGTVSAIVRARKSPTGRARYVDQNSNETCTPRLSQIQRDVHHLTQEYITTTSSVAAREGSPVEPVSKPVVPVTSELAATIQKKNWVKQPEPVRSGVDDVDDAAEAIRKKGWVSS